MGFFFVFLFFCKFDRVINSPTLETKPLPLRATVAPAKSEGLRVPTLSWSPSPGDVRAWQSSEHAGFEIEGLPWVSFLHSAVLQPVRGEAAVGPTAAFRSRVAAQFVAGPPALSQRLHEQGDRREQIAEAGQVERTVVRLGVVVQETWEVQTVWEIVQKRCFLGDMLPSCDKTASSWTKMSESCLMKGDWNSAFQKSHPKKAF